MSKCSKKCSGYTGSVCLSCDSHSLKYCLLPKKRLEFVFSKDYFIGHPTILENIIDIICMFFALKQNFVVYF